MRACSVSTVSAVCCAPRDVSAKFTVGEPPDLIKLAKTEHLTPLEERIRSLHESMNAVRDLQDQMREQDERHHQMTRSTRARLVWFTLLEAFAYDPLVDWTDSGLRERMRLAVNRDIGALLIN